MASNSKKLGELFGGTDDVKEAVLDNVNPSFVSDKDNTSTGYFDLPNGTTAQRPTAASGMIRYNSTLNLAEYYDGTIWKAIDSPPAITSISPENFTASGTTITITGSNFQSGANVKLIDTDGTELTPDSVTYVNSSSVTFDTTQAMVDNENDKFDVKVTNTSGLSSTLEDILEISDGTFSFTNSATSTLYDSARSSGFAAGGSLSGGGGESDVTISYAVTSGSLPTGGSISSSTGSVTGISAVGSDTVSNFTVTATVSDESEGTDDTYTRAFALTVKAPVITSYTSSSGSFSVPTGLTAVDVLVVAGGGGGGRAGGGGAGGLIYRPAFPVTPQGSISYSVGSGGQGQFGDNGPTPQGQDSTFGTLTAKGGGYGSFSESAGDPGGSGGGAGFNEPGGGTEGTGIQPQQPGESGQSQYGFGNPGGKGGPSPYSGGNTGGGGGGAGAVGSNGNQNPNNNWAQGGIGKQYDISGSQVYYAGGGSGAGHSNSPGDEPQSAAQGGGGRATRNNYPITIATANRGGGGGAAHNGPNQVGPYPGGGTGGSGIVIVKY